MQICTRFSRFAVRFVCCCCDSFSGERLCCSHSLLTLAASLSMSHAFWEGNRGEEGCRSHRSRDAGSPAAAVVSDFADDLLPVSEREREIPCFSGSESRRFSSRILQAKLIVASRENDQRRQTRKGEARIHHSVAADLIDARVNPRVNRHIDCDLQGIK